MIEQHTEKERRRAFWLALMINFIWINLSEVWRYFEIIRPALRDAFPGDPGVAAVTPEIFASWMIWDAVLVISATGFYWLWMTKFKSGLMQAFPASFLFTLTVFGLLWLGVVNMGLAPPKFIWLALPLAWVEQAVAALLTGWAITKTAGAKATMSERPRPP